MKRLAAVLAFTLLLVPGRTSADTRGGTANVQCELTASTDVIRPGEPFLVALTLRVAPNWSVFWKNPGEMGVPTKIVFTLPDSFRVSEVMWPTPKYLHRGELTVFGYTGEVTFLAKVTPPSSLPNGLFSVLAQVQWVEAGPKLNPWSGSFALALPVGKAGRRDPEKEKFFADALARTAQKDTTISAHYTINGSILELTATRAGGFGEGVEFFPEVLGFVDIRRPGKATPIPGGVTVRLERLPDGLKRGELAGVLASGKGASRRVVEIKANAAEVKAH